MPRAACMSNLDHALWVHPPVCGPPCAAAPNVCPLVTLSLTHNELIIHPQILNELAPALMPMPPPWTASCTCNASLSRLVAPAVASQPSSSVVQGQCRKSTARGCSARGGGPCAISMPACRPRSLLKSTAAFSHSHTSNMSVQHHRWGAPSSHGQDKLCSKPTCQHAQQQGQAQPQSDSRALADRAARAAAAARRFPAAACSGSAFCCRSRSSSSRCTSPWKLLHHFLMRSASLRPEAARARQARAVFAPGSESAAGRHARGAAHGTARRRSGCAKRRGRQGCWRAAGGAKTAPLCRRVRGACV